MQTLSERIRHLMQKNDFLTEKELSLRTGVPQPTINRILSGMTKNPRKAALKALAQFFKIPMHSLLEPLERSEDPALDLNKEPGTLVPLLQWNDVCDQVYLLNTKRCYSYITAFKELKGQLFALVVEREGLGPLFAKGTILVFQADKPAKNRDYILLNISGTPVFKQILIDGIDHYFKSLDPDLNYPILKANDSEKIIGVLIQSICEFGD